MKIFLGYFLLALLPPCRPSLKSQAGPQRQVCKLYGTLKDNNYGKGRENRIKLLIVTKFPSGRIGSHQPVVVDVLDYFTAAGNDTCPEEKNAPNWG
jgi:hypothetical protein